MPEGVLASRDDVDEFTAGNDFLSSSGGPR
jgi:hypothetical protein